MGEVIHHHRVRSYEVDHQSFLFNGRYLEICDAAMTEFFRAGGFTYPEMIAVGFDPAVVELTAGFSRPATLDDLLEVRVRCTRVGTSSTVLSFHISCDTDPVARVRTTYVNVDPDTGRSKPIPEQVRRHLAASLAPESEDTP